MNLMASGKETTIVIIFKTIPSQTGTSRILFNAIIEITIAQISIMRWLIPKEYWFMPPIISQRASHKIITVPMASAENPEIFRI